MKKNFLKVREVVREAFNSKTIRFYYNKKKISYKPGQFITIILSIKNKKKYTKSYSFCTFLNNNKFLAITIKKVKNGIVSNYLNNNIVPGDILKIINSSGDFIINNYNNYYNYHFIFLGAGSGITPLISLIKFTLYNYNNIIVSLIYVNNNKLQIIFWNQINNLLSIYKDKFNVIYSLSRKINNWNNLFGRIKINKIQKLIINFNFLYKFLTHYFICGPTGFMKISIKALDNVKIDKFSIYQESFASLYKNSFNNKNYYINIINNNSINRIRISNKITILDSILSNNINLSFSCKNGSCKFCIAKCLFGRVFINLNNSLSKKEIDLGYILTCTSYSLSNDIIIKLLN